jgi:hypothetical protein
VKTLTDTSPEAGAVQLQLLREAPPWRKLEMTFALNRALKNLIIANTDTRSAAETHRAFAERWLGSDLAEKAYGRRPSTRR